MARQDRLTKKMRLKGIGSIEAGNRFLPGYLAEHNRRFTDPPADTVDYHIPLPKGLDLDEVLGDLLPSDLAIAIVDFDSPILPLADRNLSRAGARPPKPVKAARSTRHRGPSEAPHADHPWKRSFKDMKTRKTARQI